MRKLVGIFIAGWIAAIVTPALHAQEDTDWKAQFAGLDGVAISCLRNLERKYTARICRQLTEHAAAKLKEFGIAIEMIGISYSRGATPEQAKTLANPLHLTVLVRATNPDPLGIDLRINASVLYKAAVEAGETTPPRSGHLHLWQNGLTGAGPRKRLEQASIKVAKERMDILFEIIETEWAR